MVLTEKQLEVLLFIQHFIDEEGFPPSRQEISDAFEFKGSNAAQDHLKLIEKKGYIKCHRGIARGISVIKRV